MNSPEFRRFQEKKEKGPTSQQDQEEGRAITPTINKKAQLFRSLLISGNFHDNDDLKQDVLKLLTNQGHQDGNDISAIQTRVNSILKMADQAVVYESGVANFKVALLHSKRISKCASSLVNKAEIVKSIAETIIDKYLLVQ